MSLKVAIVGCGKIADAHVEEVRKVAGYGAEVVGVCDRERLMAEQLAMRFGVPAYFDRVEEMLERTRPDVVHITTPPQSHLALARVALQAGCHVYVEKPLAMDLAEAETLIGEVIAAGKKLTVGWEYLFDPPALRLRQLATDGVLGETVHVDSVFGYGLGGPFGAAVFGDPGHWVHKLPGKLLHNVLDHILNKVVEFMPDDNPSVTAFGSRLSSARYGDHRDDILDEVRILVRGRRTTGFGLFSAHARPIGHSVRVFGTKNTALADLNARTTTLERDPADAERDRAPRTGRRADARVRARGPRQPGAVPAQRVRLLQRPARAAHPVLRQHRRRGAAADLLPRHVAGHGDDGRGLPAAGRPDDESARVKVLLTGGTGFLGPHVLEQLARPFRRGPMPGAGRVEPRPRRRGARPAGRDRRGGRTDR